MPHAPSPPPTASPVPPATCLRLVRCWNATLSCQLWRLQQAGARRGGRRRRPRPCRGRQDGAVRRVVHVGPGKLAHTRDGDDVVRQCRGEGAEGAAGGEARRGEGCVAQSLPSLMGLVACSPGPDPTLTRCVMGIAGRSGGVSARVHGTHEAGVGDVTPAARPRSVRACGHRRRRRGLLRPASAAADGRADRRHCVPRPRAGGSALGRPAVYCCRRCAPCTPAGAWSQWVSHHSLAAAR